MRIYADRGVWRGGRPVPAGAPSPGAQALCAVDTGPRPPAAGGACPATLQTTAFTRCGQSQDTKYRPLHQCSRNLEVWQQLLVDIIIIISVGHPAARLWPLEAHRGRPAAGSEAAAACRAGRPQAAAFDWPFCSNGGRSSRSSPGARAGKRCGQPQRCCCCSSGVVNRRGWPRRWRCCGIRRRWPQRWRRRGARHCRHQRSSHARCRQRQSGRSCNDMASCELVLSAPVHRCTGAWHGADQRLMLVAFATARQHPVPPSMRRRRARQKQRSMLASASGWRSERWRCQMSCTASTTRPCSSLRQCPARGCSIRSASSCCSG